MFQKRSKNNNLSAVTKFSQYKASVSYAIVLNYFTFANLFEQIHVQFLPVPLSTFIFALPVIIQLCSLSFMHPLHLTRLDNCTSVKKELQHVFVLATFTPNGIKIWELQIIQFLTVMNYFKKREIVRRARA